MKTKFLSLLILVACGGSGTASSVSGIWTGSWASRTGVSGTTNLTLAQSGDSVVGSLTFTGSPCFANGDISGTLSGDMLSATITAGGIVVALNVTITGDALSGTYQAVSAGECTGDTGTFSANR
jgi:hypothetical protein